MTSFNVRTSEQTDYMRDMLNDTFPVSWQGYNYRGEITETGYVMTHYDTVIARFNATGFCTYFDASWYSNATRQFQGRILDAMHDTDPATERVRAELAKPSRHRSTLTFAH